MSFGRLIHWVAILLWRNCDLGSLSDVCSRESRNRCLRHFIFSSGLSIFYLSHHFTFSRTCTILLICLKSLHSCLVFRSVIINFIQTSFSLVNLYQVSSILYLYLFVVRVFLDQIYSVYFLMPAMDHFYAR